MKKENTASALLNIAIPLLIIVLWLWAGYLGKINEALLPSLPKTLQTAVELIVSGKLWGDIVVSLGRVLKGFAIGAGLGIVIGTLMGLNKTIYRLLNSVVSILRPIPMMALIPLFILWLGIGETCKVSLIALGSFWSVLLNTIHGIHSVDPKLLEVAKVLEKDRKTVLLQIYLPSALPAIITGLRLGMGVAWSCVVAAEMLAASSGVGYMLMFARTMSQPDRLMVGVFAIGLIGLVIDKLMLYVQKKVSWWN
jgi:sulfonate transport system permease protein